MAASSLAFKSLFKCPYPTEGNVSIRLNSSRACVYMWVLCVYTHIDLYLFASTKGFFDVYLRVKIEGFCLNWIEMGVYIFFESRMLVLFDLTLNSLKFSFSFLLLCQIFPSLAMRRCSVFKENAGKEKKIIFEFMFFLLYLQS